MVTLLASAFSSDATCHARRLAGVYKNDLSCRQTVSTTDPTKPSNTALTVLAALAHTSSSDARFYQYACRYVQEFSVNPCYECGCGAVSTVEAGRKHVEVALSG